jgi:hypothetical protein
MSHHKTQNPWIVWYHNPSDTEWDKDSYKDIIEITSIEDYCVLKNSWNICLPKVSEGMFFLMRKLDKDTCIYPQWEDEHNIDGGYWSFKIPKDKCEQVWFTLMKHVLGECLLYPDKDYLLINGISISPKKNFSIIKIWLKKHDPMPIQKALDSAIDCLNISESIYSNHSLNIKKDKHKQLNHRQHHRKKYKDTHKNKRSYNNKYNQFNDFNNNNNCGW